MREVRVSSVSGNPAGRIGASLCAFLLAVSSENTSAGSAPSLTWGDCPTQRLTDDHFRCGLLTVPERWEAPGSGTHVSLSVAIRPGRLPSERSVLFLIGGPGGTNIGFAPLIAPSFESIDSDVVFLERRGAGYSEPSLACPSTAKNSDDSWSLPVLADCAKTLRQRGITLEAYGTAAAVRDLEALRRQLGVKQWDIFAASYGTRMALEALRLTPTSVHAAVLDSVYPGDVDPFGETPRNHLRSLDALIRSCAADAGCHQAFPDLRAAILAAHVDLDRQPLEIMGERMDGNYFVRFLADNLEESYWLPQLPLFIQLVGARDGIALTKMLTPPPEAAANRSLVPEERIRARGLWLSVECSERAPFAQSPLPAAGADGAWPAAFARQVVSGWDDDDLRACRTWNVRPSPRSVREAVKSNVPVLLFAGELDPITPPAWAEHAAKTLVNGRVLVVPRAGHTIAQEPCPMGIVRAFYSDPTAVLDPGCLPQVQPPFALTPPSTITPTKGD